MSQDDHGRIPIRSYRVVFRLERRIFQIDRFRLPFPYGVEVRALVYAVVVYAVVFLASRLPVTGALLGVFPAPVHWGLGPLGVVFAMVKLRIDGRPPHRVLASAIRWSARPKHLAGLRPCPEVGFTFIPVRELWMRPDWQTERYRRAVIAGPAKITLRYPATVEVRSAGRQRLRRHTRAGDPRAFAARRLLISPDSETPMFVGKTIRIPTGGEVRFQ
jgi:TcpE family